MKKKIVSWPKPKGFHLDDDSGLLIGNRIHRMVGGQVIGQQNVAGDAMTVFAAEPKQPQTRPKRVAGRARLKTRPKAALRS